MPAHGNRRAAMHVAVVGFLQQTIDRMFQGVFLVCAPFAAIGVYTSNARGAEKIKRTLFRGLSCQSHRSPGDGALDGR